MAKLGPYGIHPESRRGKAVIVVFVIGCFVALGIILVVKGT